MSTIKVKSGKATLHLRKSKVLVGLKPAGDNTINDSEDVEREVLQNLGGFSVVTLNRDGETVDKKLDEVRGNEDIAVGTHVYYAEGSRKPLVPTGEIFIIFKEGTGHEEQALALDEFKLELVERRTPNQVIVKVTENSPNPLKVASELQKTSLVKLAEPDLDALVDEYEFLSPKDDLLIHQWYLKNEGFVIDANWPLKKGADAKVVDGWKRLGGMGSNTITVAIIDNGFDITHPDLKDNIYKPFDLWNQSSNLTNGDTRFTHGTPCASLAIAVSNGSGMVGSAPNAKFMPVSGTSFSLRATEEMFDYCIKNGADIISCSWGTTDPNFDLNAMKEEAIAKAARQGRKGKGCIILFAVGNDDLDYVSYYSAHPDVIAVAACTSKDEHASYSNRGRQVSVCAPSNGDWPIVAARAWWDEGVSWETGAFKFWRDGKSRGERYKHFGGTSAATPIVAGICALMLSANPNLTAKEVKEILQNTADKIGLPSEYVNGHSNKFGYGRVNADKALAEAFRRKDSQGPAEEVEESVASGMGLFRFSVKRQASKGWGVQIGAFAEYGNVLIQAEKLERSFGEPVIVNINELNGQTVYKIVIGAYDDIKDARNLRNKMIEANVDGFLRNLQDLK